MPSDFRAEDLGNWLSEERRGWWPSTPTHPPTPPSLGVSCCHATTFLTTHLCCTCSCLGFRTRECAGHARQEHACSQNCRGEGEDVVPRLFISPFP
jgi:hypothetical protein